MRKANKLLSLITAAAIAMSSFASFAMTASAEEPLKTVVIGNGSDTTVVESMTVSDSATSGALSVSYGEDGLLFPTNRISDTELSNEAIITLVNPIDISQNDVEITWDQAIEDNSYGSNGKRIMSFKDAEGTVVLPMVTDYNWANIYFNYDNDTTTAIGAAPKNSSIACKIRVYTNAEGTRVAKMYIGDNSSSEFDVKGDSIKTISLAIGNLDAASRKLVVKNLTVSEYEPAALTYTLLINTAPYAKVTYGDNVCYSNGAGVAEIKELLSGTVIDYTVEKNGYTSATGSETITNENVISDAPLTILDEDTYYYEDFDTALAEANAAWGFGAGDKLYTYTADGKLNVKTSNGGRTITKAFTGIGAADRYTIEYDVTNTLSNANKTGQTLTMKFTSAAGDLFALTQTCNNAEPTGSLSVVGSVADEAQTAEVLSGETVHVKADVDGTTVAITITSGETVKLEKTFTTAGGELTGMTMSNNQEVSASLDNFVVSKYVPAVTDPVEPTTYAVTVAETTNGTATADKAEAAEDEEVTITATANDGYEVDTITAKAADDTDVTVTNGKFTMPAQAVTVTVTFKEVVAPEPTPASVNLITNGDFTNGFADWTNAADGGVYDGTISENADYIHGDGKAITNKAEAGGNAASTLRRYIPVEGGKTYNLSFYAYNTGEQNTTNSFMSAFVPVVVSEPVFGSFNGITFKDYVAYGGQNSWSEEPQSEVNQKRQDIVYQAGMNHIEYEINTPEDANYIMISLFAWTPVGRMYFSDFELYEATPEPTTYAVTVEKSENGTVTADKATAEAGATVTITATANDGYEVDTITVTDADGEAVTVADDNTFVMPAKAVTVAATFKEASTAPVDPTAYAVTVATATNGTVTVDKATAEAGATVTITATANDGYEVDTITVTDADGAAVTVADDNTFVMPAKAVTVTATFKESSTAPADPKAVIDFTNRTLTYESKGSTTVFEVSDATAAGATALAAAGAGNVLKLGSSQNGASKMLGYKADFAKEGENTVVYGGQATVSFKLEPMQVRTDKEASIELSFADINGNKILPITVGTGMTASLTVNGQAASGIAYGNYYVVTYTMDFAAKTASVTIDAADGTNCLTISNAAITAENITQLYRADSDWLYGYCAIDDIAIDATEIGVPVFYSIVINTERYAKLTTAGGEKYFADVNGKIEIPLQKPGTAFDYTLSKVGYDDVAGTVEALTGDFEDTKPMTKSSDDIIFIESEFGNANEAYVSAAGSRNDSISLGSVTLPEMSEITVDLNFAGIATEGGSHKTWALVTDGGAMVGIQFNLDGIYAWTGWTGNVNWNQSSDVGAYTVSERLGDLTTGDMTFKFVVDTTNKAVTVSYGDVSKSLTYAVEATALTSIQTGLYRNYGETRFNEITVQLPDANYLAINGVSGVAKVSGQTIERTYGLSQTVIIPDETFTWTVADAEGNAIEGVTIENGVLKVADTATPSTAVITCVGSSSADKVATFNVTIGDFQQVALVIDGPQSYDVTETSGQYTVVSAVDSFGDEVKDLAPAVVWTSSNEDVITVDAASGEATVVGAGSATITATITNGTAVSTATIPVTVATYYVVAEATGDSTVVDISGLVNNAAITGYQVTTIKDGAIVNQTVVAKADVNGTMTSTATAAAAGEKIVATYDENGAITNITATAVAAGDEIDLTAAEGTKVFFWNSLNGMAPVATEIKEVMSDATITVDTTGADSVEIAPVYQTTVGALLAIPAATYNITVTANNGARTDVYANEQMLINNLNQGSDSWTPGRVIAASTDYEVKDIVIDQGYVKFKMYDDKSGGTTVTKVVFAKVPDGVTRAKRIYTIGDSLVANYYGAAPEGQEGLVRTGWGQVFDKFVAEGVEVTNLGNSGAEAVGMLGAAFTNVKESAKAGDIVIWESGYNDRSYSTVENMKAAITEAINYCKENDIEIYLVNPNASSHDYNGSVVWAQHIRDLAAETDTPLIDLAQKSYDFLNGMYADVTDVHVLLQTYYNNVNDTLHSSYNAANCWASIVAQGLYDEGHTDIINTEYSYTFNDGIQDVTVQVVADTAEETPAE